MAAKKKAKPAEQILQSNSPDREENGKTPRSVKRSRPALAVGNAVKAIPQTAGTPRKREKAAVETGTGSPAPDPSADPVIRIGLNPEEREVVIESLIFRRNHLPGYLQAFRHKLDVIKNLLKKLSD